MDEADKIKATGNKLFKDGNFELAKAKYEKVLREYNHVNPQDEEEGKIFLNSRSNDLFALFLDETMTYSSAISKTDDEDLMIAQLQKVSSVLIQKNTGQS
ncbi:Peptidyl-prolyl cis-trans isomerase PASTICCINO1 [Acorus calamus]|uniref:Peptidyl-prolyl cis-trans isomerase PASTICCINO1 n=1 Tax=Acorus calamus TaxID=4465 RepID=A0AAV9F958_ACOCL|nr:Peptidyl-prolyl cis-trans isomerase PASTICCINO1 [Acorus calamus]